MERPTQIDLLDTLADARGKVHLLVLASAGIEDRTTSDALSAAATEALASVENATRLAGFEPLEDMRGEGPRVTYVRTSPRYAHTT